MKGLQDLWMALRAHVSRGVIRSVADDGDEQTVDVDTHYGRTRTKVPVHYPFGFASHVPHDGAVTHLVSSGADHSDIIALPPANPSVSRMSGLAEGETCLYDAVGQAIYFRNGEIIQLDAHSNLNVRIGGKQILAVDADGVVITGKLHATGIISSDDDVQAGSVSLKDHKHTGVKSGTEQSGQPV
ncbi:MAG: phage baseplate assembly protein [Acetobacter sp.]|jgi:phage gp45-like|nr:phage baseplate assembly protein [Acetobacter sp.]MCH4060534.1 phage baseplate assembly protein [Acetobacter sp.]MCH4087474.1 phage baseplate assembly protein [Acetobacter sp.]MCI1294675.1 phage baseplate assembly protein [Acetobacter sp.]MCI1321176.1 phage baseplate assembly protein [Acetobacter sp.]